MSPSYDELRRAAAAAFDEIVAEIAERLSPVEDDPTARILSDVLFGTLHGLIVLDAFLERPSPGNERSTRVLESMARAFQAVLGEGSPD